MENKLLITQALDERDLLVKKINSKIEKISSNDENEIVFKFKFQKK